MYCARSTVHGLLCTVYCARCTVHGVLCTVHYALFSEHCSAGIKVELQNPTPGLRTSLSGTFGIRHSAALLPQDGRLRAALEEKKGNGEEGGEGGAGARDAHPGLPHGCGCQSCVRGSGPQRLRSVGWSGRRGAAVGGGSKGGGAEGEPPQEAYPAGWRWRGGRRGGRRARGGRTKGGRRGDRAGVSLFSLFSLFSSFSLFSHNLNLTDKN